MSSENTLTGRNGEFATGAAGGSMSDRIARIKNWTANPTLATKSEWGDSDCAGYTARAAGRKDCTFTAEGVYDETDIVFNVFEPEDILSASLWLDGGGAAQVLYFDFPRALCDDFSMTVDVDSEEVIGWSSGWGADGIFYLPGASPRGLSLPA